jgi:hypothetical protein
VRLFDWIEAPAAIFRWIVPDVRCGADEGARWHAVEIDEVHRNNVVDDARQLAAGAGAFELQALLFPVEVVDNAFEDSEQYDIDGARLLQMEKPGDHLAGVQTVGRAQILPAAGAKRFPVADSTR